jgi:hypothetical protein
MIATFGVSWLGICFNLAECQLQMADATSALPRNAANDCCFEFRLPFPGGSIPHPESFRFSRAWLPSHWLRYHELSQL